MLLFAAFALCIIGGCFYMLTHFSSVDKNLKPMTHMAEVGEMASKVAHDLRGPLSGIHAVLDYLHQQTKDKTFSDHLNLLELSTNRLENVAGDLLKKYKGEDEEITSFNLHEVLDQLVGEYAAQSLCADVRFQKQYWQDAIWLEGRRNRWQRAFGNLVKNSLEAMGYSGTLILGTMLENHRVQISIRDSGPGMTPEKAKCLLNEGFTDGKKGGHGIGVAFVREVVTEHKGTLMIYTELNRGCEFRIELPFVGKNAANFTIELLNEEPILIIDDDPSLLQQWRMVLEAQGMKAETYACYEMYAAAHPACPPAVWREPVEGWRCTAIIDYHFENSELNGIEIIKRLRERGFTNLYLCTAEYWKPSLKKEAQELGVSICPKPLPKVVIARPEGRSNLEQIEIASSPSAPRNDKVGYTVLVIDDDQVIRVGWELMCKKLQVETLYTFPNWESLQQENVDWKAIDLAFVDKNIENSAFDGAQVIDYLKANGVAKVVLASGESESELRSDPKFANADFIVNEKIPKSFKEFFS